MAKGNRRFGPADQAVVITQLLDGATVAAAARAAGFAVQTLYDDRKRCPLFARAWADAVAESARPRLVARGTGGWWQIRRLRRNRFTRARKAAFLGRLAVFPEIGAAAGAAGVCRATVYAHRDGDPAFASAWREALACGVAVLKGRMLAEQLAAAAPFDVEPEALPDAPAAAALDPVERDLDFWRCLHLLREHRQGLAGEPDRWPRGGKRPPIRSKAEAEARMRKALAAFETRARAANYRLD
jgi:hypothetical protein